MTTRIYPVNYYDAIKPGIRVAPNTIDGPGGLTATTALRLHGQGTQNWGEAVDENFIRIAESFAGATTPPNPVYGQLWYSIKLYHLNTSTHTWSRWNQKTSVWETLSVISSATIPSNPSIGDYWFDTVSEHLYRWDSLYNQQEIDWLDRIYTKSNLQPTTVPTKALNIFNGTWTPLSAITVADTQPAGTTDGQLWFDSINKRLWVYDLGTSVWTEIILANGQSQMVGTLDLNSHLINSLASPVNANDVANKQYVLDAISPLMSVIDSSLALHIADDSVHLTPVQDTLLDGVIITSAELISLKGLTNNIVDALSTFESDLSTLMDGLLDRSGGTMIGPLKVIDPTAELDVAHKQYLENLRYLNKMLDVVIPPSGIPNNAVLKFDGTISKWVPVEQVTIDGLVVGVPDYYFLPDDVITLSSSIRTSAGVVQNVTNVLYKVDGSPIVGNVYTVPTSAGATLSITSELVGAVVVDGVPYTGLVSPAKIVYVVTSIEVTGPSAVNHTTTYTYEQKAVYSDGTKIPTSYVAWSVGAVALGTSPGLLTILSSVPVGSQTLSATRSGRTGTLPITVSVVATGLSITGPGTVNEATSTSGYVVSRIMSDGTTPNVTTLATTTTTAGSWSPAGTFNSPTLPGNTNQTVYINSSYLGKSASKPVTVTYPYPSPINSAMFQIQVQTDFIVQMAFRLTDGAIWFHYATNPGHNNEGQIQQATAYFAVPARILSRYGSAYVTADIQAWAGLSTWVSRNGWWSNGLIQQPTTANGWVGIVQFDDGPPGGARPFRTTITLHAS